MPKEVFFEDTIHMFLMLNSIRAKVMYIVNRRVMFDSNMGIIQGIIHNFVLMDSIMAFKWNIFSIVSL